jgi:superfamily II DNA or RNA helicase
MSVQTSSEPQAFQQFSPPEPGQLVEVRRRQWVVTDILQSRSSSKQSKIEHLVTLTSINDEDDIDESLQVIWEVEPGAQVIEKAGLPNITGFDDSERLDAFLDAVRWGAVTNADKGFLQSPFRSGITIEDFQLEPLVRSINMARVNLLIADDVGLGKTIEAGLVVQELFLRHRARTALIVCPASLQEKWRLEMIEKFGLEFKIVDTEYIRTLRRDLGIHANPWSSFPRLIASQDWLKSGEALRWMRQTLPAFVSLPRKFDVLIVDEAHNIAPSSSKNYALESQRTQLIREIGPHFQHKLFLTATPHNGHTESFTSLLEMLDNQRFSRTVLPSQNQLDQVMVRRLKVDLKDNEGNPLYPPRVIHALEVKYSEEERKIYRLLNEYCASRENTQQKSKKGIGTKFVNGLLKKRFFSSPAAFASTLEKHVTTVHEGKRQKVSKKITEKMLAKAILKADEDYANDQAVEEAQLDALELATRSSNPFTPEESRLIAQLRNWAQNAQRTTNSKSQAITEWIEQNLKSKGQWTENRVILFTEYRTTQQWLQKILTEEGYGEDRLAIIHGGLDKDEREDIKASFQANPKKSPLRILLATDAASEGIDLQNHCHCLIHLEIPYNPNVMEQRNGRVDRHGQKAPEVLIWHPVDSTEDHENAIGGYKEDILRALRKLESMREDMGAVNPVVAPQMEKIYNGHQKELNTQEVEMRIKDSRIVKADRDLTEKTKQLHDRLVSTQEDFHLTPEHILAAVETGLAVAEKPPLKPVEEEGIVSGRLFDMPELSGSWSDCAKGLEHPHTKVRRPITFDQAVAKQLGEDVVLVHLNHRLAQMCLRLLRSEVWQENGKINRATIRSLPKDTIDTIVAVTVSRLVITGGNHRRLHEEITHSAGYLRDRGFAREPGVNLVEGWLENSKPASTNNLLTKKITELFSTNDRSIIQAAEARSRDRVKFLENTLTRRKEQEIKDINEVLDDLELNILSIFEEEENPKQQTFSFDEKTQLKRDLDALNARLKAIPGEREEEVAVINRRYASFTDRTFPVAVIFLVPSHMVDASQ